MPASLPLKALGALTASLIVMLSLTWQPAAPAMGQYQVSIRLMAGVIMVAGPLLFAHSIGDTFLHSGGRSAFKALYWASIASIGLGVVEAASGLMAVSVLTALCLAALSFSIAGLMLLGFHRGAA